MSIWRSGCSGSQSGSSSRQSQSLTYEPPPVEEVDLLRKGGTQAVLKACTTPPMLEEGDFQAEQIILDASRDLLEEVELLPSTVLLHVYDLNEGVKRYNEVLAFSSDRMAVGGAFHVGVEVFGSEWSYGSYGVCGALPRAATGHVYQCSIHLGPTALALMDFASVLHELCDDWGAADYQVLGHNCCSFAAEMVERLGVGPMPPWVNRFARLGQEATESWTSFRTLFTRREGSLSSMIRTKEFDKNTSWFIDRISRHLNFQAQASPSDSSDSEEEPASAFDVAKAVHPGAAPQRHPPSQINAPMMIQGLVASGATTPGAQGPPGKQLPPQPRPQGGPPGSQQPRHGGAAPPQRPLPAGAASGQQQPARPPMQQPVLSRRGSGSEPVGGAPPLQSPHPQHPPTAAANGSGAHALLGGSPPAAAHQQQMQPAPPPSPPPQRQQQPQQKPPMQPHAATGAQRPPGPPLASPVAHSRPRCSASVSVMPAPPTPVHSSGGGGSN